MQSNHEIVVGNIGTVYSGPNYNEALATFVAYVESSQSGYGRAANEPVTWMRDGEIYEEYEY